MLMHRLQKLTTFWNDW